MKNGLILLGVTLSVAAFAGMMRVKTDVQTMDRERLRMVNERADLRETKRVLEAEWALLASPERLEKLAAGKGYVPGSALMIIPLRPGGDEVSISTPMVVKGVKGAKVVEVATSETELVQPEPDVGQSAPRVGPQ